MTHSETARDPDHAEKLLPAARDDVLHRIEYSLRFRRGKAHNDARDVAISALARNVLEQLEEGGFVFKKKPPIHDFAAVAHGKHLKE